MALCVGQCGSQDFVKGFRINVRKFVHDKKIDSATAQAVSVLSTFEADL
jgi:hypothetical protein